MRYLIVEKEQGFFLGGYKQFIVFAKTSIFPITSVVTFETRDEAEKYTIFLNNFSQELNLRVIEFKSDDKYVHLYDLLKAGYSEYTHGMLRGIYMTSESIH